ncbi:MAG: TRAM domain-containing protein, partial [Acholeplasmataceae bacterium]|nr:TRAM domain-containing protein [Acholeplasmataceae bacterium]
MFALTVGSKIRLEIRKQGINGEGIGYFNKLAIFVPGTILKEVVLCEIVELKERYAIARIDEIERISTKRIEPPCKFYDRCGGCQMQ